MLVSNNILYDVAEECSRTLLCVDISSTGPYLLKLSIAECDEERERKKGNLSVSHSAVTLVLHIVVVVIIAVSDDREEDLSDLRVVSE